MKHNKKEYGLLKINEVESELINRRYTIIPKKEKSRFLIYGRDDERVIYDSKEDVVLLFYRLKPNESWDTEKKYDNIIDLEKRVAS